MSFKFIKRLSIELFALMTILISFSAPAKVFISDDNLKVINDRTFTIAAGNNLILDASSGDVQISSWKRNEVKVRILGNEQAKEKVEFIFKESKDAIRVQAKYGWALSNLFKKIQMRFEIKVPEEFNIEATTAGGEVKLKDIKGKIIAKTSGGEINLLNLSGKINASTSGGDIIFTNVNGSIEINTSGGDVVGKQFTGNIQATTSGGDISLTGADAKILASTSGGDITLDYKGQNQGIELRTSGGDIIIKLPSDFNASANLSALGGIVKCDFKGNNAVKISSTKFEADINNGGNSLILKTSGGDIMVFKK